MFGLYVIFNTKFVWSKAKQSKAKQSKAKQSRDVKD